MKVLAVLLLTCLAAAVVSSAAVADEPAHETHEHHTEGDHEHHEHHEEHEVTCGENEKASECATPCVTTCENYDSLHFCAPLCDGPKKCVCEKGYIRDVEGGKCILPTECPSKTE
ncbi:cysteine-rich venom protein 1-like [Ctenocephalides felis]|uniref:cysteine-rich venom protein 1-like n=1 Tax=Ctenocephalides felis TaxID=7515 RepID=UPI000E6E4B17|nr:cysteine-rich venom protein 1-like [Ctenocephalides felis]